MYNIHIFQQDLYISASLSESGSVVNGPVMILLFSLRKSACLYGVGGTRSLSGCQGGSSLKMFERHWPG